MSAFRFQVRVRKGTDEVCQGRRGCGQRDRPAALLLPVPTDGAERRRVLQPEAIFQQDGFEGRSLTRQVTNAIKPIPNMCCLYGGDGQTF